MGKWKMQRRSTKKWTKNLEEEPSDSGVPIPNLPEKFLLMRVKSSTKIRNVLGYALKEFPNYENVVWTAAGQGIGKAISCAELFKKKTEGLHQMTKLRYVQSQRSKAENKNGAKVETRHVPEIHILLAKEIKDTSEPGYQGPDDRGEFLNGQETKNTRKGGKQEVSGGMTSIDAEEFAAMGLRTGQKRPKKEQQAEAPPKKNKKRGNDNR